AFLITDGVTPSNEGRGYVLRRIMRRAIRHGYKLGAPEAFFHTLVPTLVAEMGAAFPELAAAQAQIERVVAQEEQRFAATLAQGMQILEQAIAQLEGSEIPGETVFQLYDTYGFPVDLTNDVARERGLTLDSAGFEAAMERQRERARSASQFGADYHARIDVDKATEFIGYDDTAGQARVIALLRQQQQVDAITAGDAAVVVLDRTPFYGESGGQVGDTSTLVGADGDMVFRVTDTRRQDGVFLHVGQLEQGTLAVDASVQATIDAQRRQAIVLNHSGTHLLHAALRDVLGTHVQQKGSLVAPERLRFDFSHFEPVGAEALAAIEAQVNEHIRADIEGQF